MSQITVSAENMAAMPLACQIQIGLAKVGLNWLFIPVKKLGILTTMCHRKGKAGPAAGQGVW